MRALWIVALLGVGCLNPPCEDCTEDAGVTPDSGAPPRRLGLNDVTFLLPLEPLSSLTTINPLPQPDTWLPQPLFTRLTEADPISRTHRERLRVIAVRVDLCDRVDLSPCVAGQEGSLRLVLQPMLPTTPPSAEDITLHAFFPIPSAELPEVVTTLRELAVLQNVPRGAALQVSTAFTSNAQFRARLGSLVTRHVVPSRLLRLTFFGQLTFSSQVKWVFRGEEIPVGATTLGPITIPNVAATSQVATLIGLTSFEVTPLANAPAGMSLVANERFFRVATRSEQEQSLRGLLAIDNPTLHTANSVQCIGCHVSTTLLPLRALDAGIDPSAFAERFTSSEFDLTPLGPVDRTRSLRALGYLGTQPLASQRVVNESARVIEELEARFGP